MYMLTLGDFNYKNFSKGKDNMLLWVFFLLGTFICLIVFFNMVVAIMGNTFGNVLEVQEESALYEQLQLIEDFLWLVNPKDTFKGMKYIVCV